MSEEIHVVVIGNQCEEVVKQAAIVENVKKVLHLDDPLYENPVAENIASVVVNLSKDYTHIVTPASTFGKNFMPRVAALLDLSQISDVIKIEDENTFIRPIYAGNALATIRSIDTKKFITVRSTSFSPAEAEGGAANIIEGPEAKVFSGTDYIERDLSESDRPELTAAKVVVSGGRGLQSSENFKLITDLADKLKHLLSLSKEEKKKIIKNARTWVNERYNIEKMYEANHKLYNSIIK